jgi:SSS family solute:Na+ symporter
MISLLARRRATRGFISFLISGKEMPWWIIGFSAFATYEGATSFLGWPGVAWKDGIIVAWQVYATSLGVLAFTLFIIPIFAKMKRLTLPEIFGERYGNGIRSVVAILSYSRLLGGGAIMLLGIADTLHIFLGLPYIDGIIIALLLMSFYTFISGQYGIMYADVFQAMFTIVSAFGAPIVLLLAIGHGSFATGWQTMLTTVPAGHFNLMGGSANGMRVVLGYVAIWFFSQILRPEMYGRIFSARSTRDGVYGWLLFASIVPFQQSCLILGGLLSRVVVPKLASPDLAIVTALDRSSSIFAAIYGVGIVSACTAVASASFFGAAAIYMTDFHSRYVNKNISHGRFVWYTRLGIIVFALVSAFWALENKQIITIISQALTVLAGGVLVPYLGMFFWARMTTLGAYAASIVGGTAAIAFAFFFPTVYVFNLPGIVVSILLSLIAAIIGTLLSTPDYEAVARFAETHELDGLKRQLLKVPSISADSIRDIA